MDKTQIHILLLQERLGTISDDDQFKLDQILRVSPQARALKELVNATPVSSEDTFTQNAVWENIENKAKTQRKQARIRNYSIAAAIAAVLLATATWLALRTAKPDKMPTAGPVMYDDIGKPIQLAQVGTHTVGESQLEFRSGKTVIKPAQFDTIQRTLVVPVATQADLVLADGSRMLVNSGTEIQLPLQFGSQVRQISITGEAWLEIAGDAARPFIVRTPGSEVKVLGTQFAVRTFGSASTEVILTEGTVLVMTASDSLRLTAGQKLTMTPGRRPAIVPLDSTYDCSWTSGRYKFLNPTIAEINDILHRWFDLRVLTSLPSNGQLNIRGVIDRSATAAQNLQRLNEIGAYRFRLTSNNIVEIDSR